MWSCLLPVLKVNFIVSNIVVQGVEQRRNRTRKPESSVTGRALGGTLGPVFARLLARPLFFILDMVS